MLIDNIKKENSTVFIFGINSVSFGLINYLTSNEIKVVLGYVSDSFANKYKQDFVNNKYLSVIELNKIDFNRVDYFVICRNILFEKDELDIFIKRLDNIKDRVFVDIEFVYMLFPDNKYIGVFGSSHNFITSNILNNILNNYNIKYVDFSSYNNIHNIKNNISFDDSLCFGAIQNHKIDYLKQINFDVLAILDSNFCSASNENFIEYIKEFLLNNQISTLILNIDDNVIKNFYDSFADNIECKIITISVSKILNDGISYINGTIYDYLDGGNESYDITINDYFLGDINKISLLCSFIISNKNNINSEDFIDSIKNFNGLSNYLECVGQFENIKFINNVGADTDKLFYSPFDIYDNIYTIFLVNDKQNDLFYLNEYLKKNVDNVFFVDICGLLDLSKINSKNNFLKFDNLKDTFDFVVKQIDFEDKEQNTTVLLSSIINDEMNCYYYYEYVNEYNNLIKGLK